MFFVLYDIMKLKEDIFKPGILLRVVDNTLTVNDIQTTEFSAWCYPDQKVIPIGTSLMTVAITDFCGIPKVVFKIVGVDEFYTSFWPEIITFTEIE